MKKFTLLLGLIILNSLIKAQPDWTLMSSGTTKDINAVWGSSPYNMYAVGEDGLILHYDGIVWENVSSGITSDLVDIIGFSASEIYILTSDTLYERVGNTWGVFASSPFAFHHANTIWGTSGTNLFVGGGGGVSQYGIYFYNGVEWGDASSDVGGSTTIWDIYGSEAGDLYAGGSFGSNGMTSHYKDCTGANLWWQTVLTSEAVTGVWATGTDNAFASTRNGIVYGYIGQVQNGICWREIWNDVVDLGFEVAELEGIWGFSDRIYTFGSKNRLPIGSTTSLIYQFDGQSWNEMTTQTDSTNFKTVYSVWGTDTSNVFAVGENGLILKLGGEIYDTLVVNKTTNEPDLSPGDGFCDVGGPMINGKPPCSLNAAIMESNATQSDDNIIIFDIPGELPQTIIINPQLPAITDKVVIKAPRKIVGETSEPGINLLGSALVNSNGLTVTNTASGTEFYNLIINLFKQHGVKIDGASETIINGCHIDSNQIDGIHILNSSFNQIGGEGIDSRNIISGNGGSGISILGTGSENNIIINNFIGTTPDGMTEMSNGQSGIIIENSSRNEIGKNLNGSGNLISGNISAQVHIISSFYNKIKGNIIGLNINGEILNNAILRSGIALNNSSRNEIGGFNSDDYLERNIISGNLVGLSIYKGARNIVEGNIIGLDIQGIDARKNGFGIDIFESERNIIGASEGFLGGANLISGNLTGIRINGARSIANTIANNIIGSNYNADSLGNGIGIQLLGEIDTRIGTSKVDPINSENKSNLIYYNMTGVQIANLIRISNTEVLSNHFYKNQTAVNITTTENLTINNNHFDTNEKAIFGTNSDLFIHNNLFTNSSSPGSSIHLTNSYGDIKNNLITLDAGDAIKLDDGSTADINYNNIFDNSGFGVNNTTPSIITTAQSNWWGDASGPGGQGPGNGDPVSTGVDFSNWLQQILAVTVTASKDTAFTSLGSLDSLGVFLSNWLNPDDTLNIILNDDLNWLQGPANYSIYLDSAFGNSSEIFFQVPGSVTAGTINLVQVTAVSQSNPSHSQTDTFYIEAYQPFVNTIFITPDSVNLAPGDSIQFFAAGYDQNNKIVNFNPQWNSSGGIINSEGWFVAGTQTGTFEVTAADPFSLVQDTATVFISIIVDVKEELAQIPTEYNLYQNYPNPFNPVTTIRYAIPFASTVTMTIYNILGEQIEKLINEVKNPGTYEINWNASKLASGVYIYMLQAESIQSNKVYRNVKKMILLK